MSWAAHEFETYVLQKHVGVKVSFLGIALGTYLPDWLTKSFVYSASDPAAFHRGWPGAGFTHSLTFGLVVGGLVLALTRSRSWGLGVLLGHWLHVLTDITDSAGIMPFFPFATDPLTLNMWRHAGTEGPTGDAVAYYSSLGGVWDLAWFVILLLVARNTLRADYFREVIVAADPRAWGWLHRRLRLPEAGLVLLYRGLFFYGAARMVAWWLHARFDARMPMDLGWGGPSFVPESRIASDLSTWELIQRTATGAALFAVFTWCAWHLVLRRLWDRAPDPPAIERGRGLRAAFD